MWFFLQPSLRPRRASSRADCCKRATAMATRAPWKNRSCQRQEYLTSALLRRISFQFLISQVCRELQVSEREVQRWMRRRRKTKQGQKSVMEKFTETRSAVQMQEFEMLLLHIFFWPMMTERHFLPCYKCWRRLQSQIRSEKIATY